MSAFEDNKLAQVAIVVRDIETTSAQYAALLGVEKPSIIETAPGDQVRQTYRGSLSVDRAKLAFFDLGGVQLELIEPIGDDSAWAEGLIKNGESLHHIAFWTQNMAESAKELAEAGAPMIMRGDMGDGQYAYFDGSQTLGAMVELLEHKRTELS